MPNIALEQVIVAAITIAFMLYLHASDCKLKDGY